MNIRAMCRMSMNPLFGSMFVCGPTTGDYFNLLSIVLLTNGTYSSVTTFNIRVASTENASE